MPSFEGLEGTFDTVVNRYEKMRPGYAPELYQMIFDYVNIGGTSRAVEVGSGSGQATLPVLEKGCEIVSVEYGENFSKLLAEKFKDYKFSVITGKFEDVELPSDSFDLVFSATAFHWVPEDAGYKKVYRILKSGGAFARFANNPFTAKNDPALAAEIDSYYEEYYNRFHNRKSKPKIEFNEERAAERAAIAFRISGAFGHIFRPHRDRRDDPQ